VWGPVRILHPLWQGKGAFLKLPWSTSASFKHYKCYILYSNAVMSILGQGYWERRRVGGTHTRDTGEKERNLSLLTYCEFKPGFCSQRCSQIIWLRKNLNGVNWWPDWFLAYCFPCDIGALFPTVPSHSVHDLIPKPSSICWKRKKTSYPMHVSGHGTVEWVQRYACAKWDCLAGRGVSFSRGRPKWKWHALK
jgi:hypothetical protein